MLNFMNLIPPGAFIAVLGFIAAVMSFFDLPRRGWKRAVVVGLLFLLMAGEIYVLRRDQNTATNNFIYIVNRFNNTDTLLTATQQSQIRVEALALQPQTPQLELKRTAIALSSQILKFLTERNMGEPQLKPSEFKSFGFGGFGPWQAAVDRYTGYSVDTLNLYRQQFGPSVVTVHDELAKRGLSNKQFDERYLDAGDTTGIREVAERMGALAEQIH
jgi:hypothetical protein